MGRWVESDAVLTARAEVIGKAKSAAATAESNMIEMNDRTDRWREVEWRKLLLCYTVGELLYELRPASLGTLVSTLYMLNLVKVDQDQA
jgi:hypothetical protein